MNDEFVFEVAPKKRTEIRLVAAAVRKITESISGRNAVHFPIVDLLEIYLPQAVPEFHMLVEDMDTMGNNHALTQPSKHLIQVRVDVYEGAVAGRGRDRFTLAHEVGHYVMHPDASLARRARAKDIPPYRSSEWQADAFAGELLVDARFVGDCEDANEVAELCGVSLQCAQYQFNQYSREGLLRNVSRKK